MKSWTTTLAAIAIPLLASAAQACPLCKDSIPGSDAQAAAGVSSGFNTSIYFMLAGLFSVIGFISFVIVKGVRDTDSRFTRGFPIDDDQNSHT
jgi:hypothetical protein